MRLILLLLSVGLMSCKPGSWSEKKSFPNTIWAYSDSLIIEPEISDTSSLQQTWLELTINESYPFRNFYIREVITTPSDSSFVRIQEFELMKEDGSWSQKPGWFGNVSFKFPLLSGFKFQEKGIWKISCKQYMRTDSLEGVESVKWELK